MFKTAQIMYKHSTLTKDPTQACKHVLNVVQVWCVASVSSGSGLWWVWCKLV